MNRTGAASLLLLQFGLTLPMAGQEPCSADPVAADPSLYCLPLLSTAAAPHAQGMVTLHPVSSPFGMAVTREGRALYDLTLTISGLPEPGALGHRAFLAWATTPELEPMIRLGPVHNGRTQVGPIDLERFIIMVSAEDSPAATERMGPLLLRGSSPSLMMLPHGTSALPPQLPAPHHHNAADGWAMPPMHPQASRMPSGLERFRPDVEPFLPIGNPGSLPEAGHTRVYRLADGDSLTLTATRVRQTHRGHARVMYAYDGQIPGPRLELPAGATITVRFINHTDLPSSIHWHGLRLANAHDGVPGLTQSPVPPGGEFIYRVHAPDPGLFWYHPHQREDAAQDLGLAANIIVRPLEQPASGTREVFLMLDDLLDSDSGPVPYGRQATTHALMGRFGNRLLVNGRERWNLTGRPGERVRLYLTNSANARTFNLSIPGITLQVLASDAGLYDEARSVENVVIAPAERYVVDLELPRKGNHVLVNQVRGIDRMTGRFFGEVDTLGVLKVRGKAAPRVEPRPERDRRQLKSLVRRFQHRRPDRTLLLTLRTRNLPFGLIQALRLDTAYVQPIEWTSSMPMMDWLSTGRQVSWIIRDSLSGAAGMEFHWQVARGEPLVVRLRNDRHVLHPMAHPVHLHGQRFLVLTRNGTPNEDPVWKDTVLVPAGGTVDLLIDTSNPGRWMLHCHIAEHLESGMHTVLTVQDGEDGEGGDGGRI